MGTQAGFFVFVDRITGRRGKNFIFKLKNLDYLLFLVQNRE